jgi:hypothetical protein
VLVLVLVDAKQKVLGVVLMMVALEELEAEVGVAKVESLEEAEVNHICTHCMFFHLCVFSSILNYVIVMMQKININLYLYLLY